MEQVVQNSTRRTSHLSLSWSTLMDLMMHSWPELISLDVFGRGPTATPIRALSAAACFPPYMRTIFLADSLCTDTDLFNLLTHVPQAGLRELGLSCCPNLTNAGILKCLKNFGRSLSLLTLIAISGPWLTDAHLPPPYVLDEAIQYMPNLQVLDFEGHWCSDNIWSDKNLARMDSLVAFMCVPFPEVAIPMLI